MSTSGSEIARMQNFYSSLRDGLLAKRKEITSIVQQTKIKGDYSEALIRDFIQQHISQAFTVGHGIIYDERNGKTSGECDGLIYFTNVKPITQYQDLVITTPDSIKFAIQVKSTLNSSTLKEAIKNLQSVKEMNDGILCWVVGFTARTLLKTLYFNAWKSGVIQYLHVFESRCKTEDKELLEKQTSSFIHFLKQDIGTYAKRIHFMIHNKKGEMVVLDRDYDEQKVKEILTALYID